MSQGDTAQKQRFEKMPGAYRRESNSLISEVFWRDRGHWETPPEQRSWKAPSPSSAPSISARPSSGTRQHQHLLLNLCTLSPIPSHHAQVDLTPAARAARLPARQESSPRRRPQNLQTLCASCFTDPPSPTPQLVPGMVAGSRSPEDQSANLTKTGCPVPVEVASLPPLIGSRRSPSKPGPQA